MTNLDDIRSALAAIADEAPPAQRVRANLDVAARRQRQRRTLLRVAGAGGLAASAGVAGAGYLAARRSPRPPTPTDEPGRGWLKVPYRYRPTWLPDGIGQSDHWAAHRERPAGRRVTDVGPPSRRPVRHRAGGAPRGRRAPADTRRVTSTAPNRSTSTAPRAFSRSGPSRPATANAARSWRGSRPAVLR